MMTNRDGSRLPAEPAYWDGLAARIESSASETFAARIESSASETSGAQVGDAAVRSDRSWVPALAAAAVLAVLGTWLATEPPATVPASPIARALQPTDPLADALLGDPLPPDIGTLLRTLDPSG